VNAHLIHTVVFGILFFFYFALTFPTLPGAIHISNQPVNAHISHTILAFFFLFCINSFPTLLDAIHISKPTSECLTHFQPTKYNCIYPVS
jgi:hypothetical protein